MAKVHICSIVLLFSTRGSCAASSESPIRKRFASVQVATDFDLDDLDGLANSTSTLVPSAVSPASPIRKRVASGQVAANGGIDMPHGLVDSTPKLSPTTVLKGNMREHMEINAQGNLETILANTRQVVADGSIDTYHDLADSTPEQAARCPDLDGKTESWWFNTIDDNIRNSRAWYIGLPKTWWWGKSADDTKDLIRSCAAEVKCSCTTPNAGTAGHNQYKCTDGTIAYCGSTQACYATAPFNKGKWDDGCKVSTHVNKWTAKSPGGYGVITKTGERGPK